MLNVSPPPKKRPLVRWPFAVAGGLALLFVVSGIAIGIYQSNVAGNRLFSNEPPPPVKGWISEHSETVAFQPGQSISGFRVNTFGTPARVRVDINASSPVTVAYFNSRFDDQVRSDPSAVALEGFSKCLRQGVLRNTVDCELPSGGSYTLLILDERNMQSAIVAGAGAVLGMKGPAEQALARNDVSLSLSSYRCVQNCRGY